MEISRKSDSVSEGEKQLHISILHVCKQPNIKASIFLYEKKCTA